MSEQAGASTPHGQLIAEIMDSRIPKTEREHAAAREICAMVERLEKLKGALRGLIGASTIEELEAVELGCRVLPGPDRDRVVALNAIHALQDEEKQG